MIAADSRNIDTLSSNNGRRGKRNNRRNSVEDASPLVYLHHAQNSSSSTNLVSQMTPEAKLWLQQLTPVLSVYDYDCKDIMELLHQCNFDSAKIQAAVDSVYEERQGHEQDEWQTQRRPPKKTSVETGGDATSGKRNNRRHNYKKLNAGAKIDFENSKPNNKHNQNSRLHGEEIDKTETTKISLTEKNATSSPQGIHKRATANTSDTTTKGTWAKVVSRTQAVVSEPVLVTKEPESTAVESLSSTVISKPNIIIPESVKEVSKPVETKELSIPETAVKSPRGINIENPSIEKTHDVVLPITNHIDDVVLPITNRIDDVVLPYAASNHREVTGLKFGNITKHDTTSSKLFIRSKIEEIPVPPPGLVAEPKRDYNFQHQTIAIQGFHPAPIYDNNQSHNWDRPNNQDLEENDQSQLEGGNNRRQQHIKTTGIRRGGEGYYRNSHYPTIHQCSYEDQYNWSSGNYIPQTYGNNIRTDFGTNELDAHAAAAAAVLKSQHQNYSTNYFPYNTTSYENSHITDDNTGGYYPSYGNNQHQIHPPRNIQSTLGQHRTTKTHGPCDPNKRNNSSINVQPGSSSVFIRNGYNTFNTNDKSYEYPDQPHNSREREKLLDPSNNVSFRQQPHHVPPPQSMVLLGSGSQGSLQGLQRPRDYQSGPYTPHSNYFYEGNNNGEYGLLQQQQQHIGGFSSRNPGLDHVYGTTAMYPGNYSTTQYTSNTNTTNRHL